MDIISCTKVRQWETIYLTIVCAGYGRVQHSNTMELIDLLLFAGFLKFGVKLRKEIIISSEPQNWKSNIHSYVSLEEGVRVCLEYMYCIWEFIIML